MKQDRRKPYKKVKHNDWQNTVYSTFKKLSINNKYSIVDVFLMKIRIILRADEVAISTSLFNKIL